MIESFAGKTPSSGLVGLTSEDIAEFQALLEREAGLRLDTAAAWKRATQLVSLVRVLMGPIPEDPEAGLSPNGVVRRQAHLADRPVDR